MYRAAVHHVGDYGFKLFQVLCSDFAMPYLEFLCTYNKQKAM